MAARPEISITVPKSPSPANKTEDENEAALSEMAGLFVLWLAEGCGEGCTERRGCRIASGGIDKIRNNAGLKTHEQNEEHRHPMPGNRHTKRPDKSLGRSIAPRGSSRSNCQVKAILHGGIETEAEMRGRHRGVEREDAGDAG